MGSLGPVGLTDQRVVRGIGVATGGAGVAAVASGRVAAGRRGVATRGADTTVMAGELAVARSLAIARNRTAAGRPSAAGAQAGRRQSSCRSRTGCCRYRRYRRYRPWPGRLPPLASGEPCSTESTRCSASSSRSGDWAWARSCPGPVAAARRPVGLVDRRVVRRAGVAAGGAGVAAVAAGRVAAGRRGVATRGAGAVTADRDRDGVAVADLGVSGAGVAPGAPVAAALPPVAEGSPWVTEETLLCTCPTTGSGGVEAPAGAAATAMAALAARTAAMRFIVFLCSM